MIRRPPRSTQSRSSAASDVYKRQPPPRRRRSSGRAHQKSGILCDRSPSVSLPTSHPANAASRPIDPACWIIGRVDQDRSGLWSNGRFDGLHIQVKVLRSLSMTQYSTMIIRIESVLNEVRGGYHNLILG